jgi:hypothetical protein
MAFINGNTSNVNFLLTKKGKEILLTKGLEKEIVYYSLWDDNFIYTLDVSPSLMPDVNGDSKSKVDLINNKYELTKK